MFMLSSLEDHVRVGPEHLGLSTASAVEQQIKQLYCDKVVANVGLVVTVYDVLHIQGGDVHVGDGGAHFNVQFRLVVFRPFIGEVLMGTIHSATEAGIAVDLGFTKDVHVPEQYMQTPGSQFDAESMRWVWHYEDEALPLEAGARVHFRVREVTFPSLADSSTQLAAAAATGESANKQAVFQPMLIVGDIDGDGLGCLHWWDEVAEDA